MMEGLLGKSLGRYHIVEQLGEGGMATVYKAYDTMLDRTVAIKIIRPEMKDQANFLIRFRREAKALAQLSHPNIVHIHDYGEESGYPFLVMDYLSGSTLKHRMGKPVPYQEAAKLILPIARALEYAHNQKIIHRDIKPSNIMITEDGQVMLTDFGIARILESQETADLTSTSLGAGTPTYMAPEQASRNFDHRVDIYGLGVVLFELITGRPPYQADTPLAVILKHANDPLPRPKQFVPTLPNSVENAILKALQKKPEHRYANMNEFAAILQKLAEGDKVKVGIDDPELKKFLPFLFAGMGLIIVLLSALVFLVQVAARQPQTPVAEILTDTPSPIDPTLTTSPSPTNAPPTETPTPLPLLTARASITATRESGNANIVLFMDDMSGGVYVPAGDFVMGAAETDPFAEPDQFPQRVVFLDKFIIDELEVTNKQYRACVQAGGCPPPDDNSSGKVYYTDSQYDEYPVVHIRWNMAQSYCSWVGRRLPTEAEWEKAARGWDGRNLPWGLELACEFANFHTCQNQLQPARSNDRGRSIYGVYNMIGNVAEWVADWYSPTYYAEAPSKNPGGPAPSTLRIVRGGSFESADRTLNASYRMEFDPNGSLPGLGFRCADTPDD